VALDTFSIFYLLPISFASWHIGKGEGIIIAILSSIIWFFADFFGGHIYSSTLFLIWNTVMRLSVFMIIALILSNYKNKILKLHKKELNLQKNKTIIETFQKLTMMIINNISSQNSEVIKWVNEKKHKDGNVPEVLDKSSKIIGESVQILAEVSFVSPYAAQPEIDADTFIDLLNNRLSNVKSNISNSKH
jgi:hypothetical protein